MALATQTEILKHLESVDLNDLLDRMQHYVQGRFYNKSEKVRQGVDYLDFCYNVLIKACNGTRNWDKDKTTFELFVFGALKSDLYNFFRKHKKGNSNNSIIEEGHSESETYLIELNEFIEIDEIQDDEEDSTIDFNDISSDAIDMLKDLGADELEIAVFECWLSGYYKPKEIAELNNVSTFEVNNAIKRLSRKRVNLQRKWRSLKK